VYSIRSHQQNCVRVVTKDDLIASVWGADQGGTDVSGCKEGKERSWTQTTDVEKRAEELRQAGARVLAVAASLADEYSLFEPALGMCGCRSHKPAFGCASLVALTAWFAADPGFDDVRDCLGEALSGFGRLTAVRHSAEMSETPPCWARPSVPLGTHAAAWPNGK
jgi:hypothetical protein